MHDARLGDGLRPDRADGLGEAFEPVADHHEHVAGAAAADLGEDPQPVLGAFAVAVLPGPQPQDVPLAVGGYPQRDVDGPVGDLAVADLDMDGVQEQDRVNRVQRPGLPFGQPSSTRSVMALIVSRDTWAP